MVETQLLSSERSTAFTLDIGGEGRHQAAWNLNPSPVKTKGADRGSPIPRLILGRAELIPLPDKSVDRLIVERTPLRRRALDEIRRVITPTGLVILRHAVPPDIDPHRLAVQVLAGRTQQRTVHIDGQRLQETVFSEMTNVCRQIAKRRSRWRVNHATARKWSETDGKYERYSEFISSLDPSP